MNVSITVQGMAKVCRGDFPVGKICDGADLNVKPRS